MEAILFFASALILFRAGIQESNLNKLKKENKELKKKLGR